MFAKSGAMRHCAHEEAQSSKRPRHRRVLLSLVVAIVRLTLLVSVVLAVTNSVTIDGDVTPAGDWDDETCSNDEGGADDLPGQKDLTRMCAASNYATTQPANTLYLLWAWDDTGYPGANTGDACALFDTNSNGNIDRALCVTIEEPPLQIQATNLYSCDDSFSDRCGGSSSITFNGSCALDADAPDAFGSAGRTGADCSGTNCLTQDPTAECSLPISDLGVSAGAVVLTGVCSFPSTVPNSDPSDCLLEGNPASRINIDTSNGNNYLSDSTGTPTVITLVSLSARSAGTSPMPPVFVPAFVALGLVAMGVLALRIRHRRW